MATRKVKSKRQPSLPGFPDIPEKLEIRIPKMPWEQIDGDMDPGAHGGTIAMADGDHIELLKIQPVREYVGDKEAADVGFPFWTKEAWFDLADLDPKNDDVRSALDSIGIDLNNPEKWFEEITPEQRALTIASALLDYGRGDEGPSGWSKDLPDHEVKWSSRNEIASLREYLSGEDDSFKDDVLEYSEIRSNIEAEVQKMVDENAAQGWSQLDDQTMIDLDKQGYDGQSAWVIAAFGNEPMIAVNTDTTFGADFAREIGVPTTKNNVYIWSETGTRELEVWLEKEGYETVRRMGGAVPSTEGYAIARFVIEAVAREMDLDKDVVKDAAEGVDGWPKDRGHGDQEIPGSTDGDTTVWAKKVEHEEQEELEEARRRGPSRGLVRASGSAETLPVIFRAERSGDSKGEVTAVFPTLPGTGWQDFTVYAHLGQHSMGTLDWYTRTRAATPAEYAPLLAEIRRIYEQGQDPVKLHVVERFSSRYDDERRKNAQRR